MHNNVGINTILHIAKRMHLYLQVVLTLQSYTENWSAGLPWWCPVIHWSITSSIKNPNKWIRKHAVFVYFLQCYRCKIIQVIARSWMYDHISICRCQHCSGVEEWFPRAEWWSRFVHACLVYSAFLMSQFVPDYLQTCSLFFTKVFRHVQLHQKQMYV